MGDINPIKQHKETYLALGNEDGNGVVLSSWGQCVVGSSLDSQSVPDLEEVMALEELDFVGNKSSAVLLIGGVLQVPVALLLLNEAA